MKLPFVPNDQIFWSSKKPIFAPLKEDISADVVIVGGGMAGLSAAQAFREKGCSVVLVEQYYCGAGASGKSSGFIGPDSEMPLRNLIDHHGPEEARKIWDFITSGVTRISDNIKKYNLDCDYRVEDYVVIANSTNAFNFEIKAEYNARKQINLSGTLYKKEEMHKIIGSKNYDGAVKYSGTFGIDSFKYCRNMSKVLKDIGVDIYEETPAIEIIDNKVITPYGAVTAKNIVVCIDRYAQKAPYLADKVYQAQTFLMISAPLADLQVKQIFPDKPLMVCDTDLVYQYFRLTKDNRLLLGGSNLLYTYAAQEKHNSKLVINKLTNYFKAKFPDVNMQFDYIWPGMIGISKDLLPIAGFDSTNKNIYYITAATGLPWAAALGHYSAERVVDNNMRFDKYFAPDRHYKINPIIQKIIGTKITFALSNWLK